MAVKLLEASNWVQCLYLHVGCHLKKCALHMWGTISPVGTHSWSSLWQVQDLKHCPQRIVSVCRRPKQGLSLHPRSLLWLKHHIYLKVERLTLKGEMERKVSWVLRLVPLRNSPLPPFWIIWNSPKSQAADLRLAECLSKLCEDHIINEELSIQMPTFSIWEELSSSETEIFGIPCPPTTSP